MSNEDEISRNDYGPETSALLRAIDARGDISPDGEALPPLPELPRPDGWIVRSDTLAPAREAWHSASMKAYGAACARAVLAAPQNPPEPTQAMLDAARDWSHAKYGKAIGNEAASGCYRAMVAAAPQNPPAVTATLPNGVRITGSADAIKFIQDHVAQAQGYAPAAPSADTEAGA